MVDLPRCSECFRQYFDLNDTETVCPSCKEAKTPLQIAAETALQALLLMNDCPAYDLPLFTARVQEARDTLRELSRDLQTTERAVSQQRQ